MNQVTSIEQELRMKIESYEHNLKNIKYILSSKDVKTHAKIRRIKYIIDSIENEIGNEKDC